MDKKLLNFLILSLAVFLPVMVLAAQPVPVQPLAPPTAQPGCDPNSSLPCKNASFGVTIANITRFVWGAFAAFSVIMFMLAGIKFLTSQGDPQARHLAQQFVIWGFIGLVIAVLGYSAVWIVRSSLGI